MKQAERLGKASRDQRAKGRSKRCTNSVYALERVQQQLHRPLGFSARLYSLNLSISVTSCLSKSCLHEWPPYAVAIRTNLCLLAYRTKRQSPCLGPTANRNCLTEIRLYCTNLPDKLRKYDLRLSLYTLFSTYGTVLDVVAMKTEKMRGQAHIVFKDVQASTQAMRALQGFEFFGKEMVSHFFFNGLATALNTVNFQKIVYAKGTSDVIARLRGTYNVPTTTATQATGASTDLQKSIFSGPPGSTALPPKPAGQVNGEAQAAHGTKRPREEESDQEEAPMDEDSDVPMEASSDED